MTASDKYHAHQLAAKPDAALNEAVATLAESSRASESEVIHQRYCDDGSQLLAKSREGAAVVFEVVPPPKKWKPSDLATGTDAPAG